MDTPRSPRASMFVVIIVASCYLLNASADVGMGIEKYNIGSAPEMNHEYGVSGRVGYSE